MKWRVSVDIKPHLDVDPPFTPDVIATVARAIVDDIQKAGGWMPEHLRERLLTAEDESAFNFALDRIYDWADHNGVFLGVA